MLLCWTRCGLVPLQSPQEAGVRELQGGRLRTTCSFSECPRRVNTDLYRHALQWRSGRLTEYQVVQTANRIEGVQERKGAEKIQYGQTNQHGSRRCHCINIRSFNVSVEEISYSVLYTFTVNETDHFCTLVVLSGLACYLLTHHAPM